MTKTLNPILSWKFLRLQSLIRILRNYRLRLGYPLPDLLKQLALSKSSYYYQKSVKRKPDKYADIHKMWTIVNKVDKRN